MSIKVELEIDLDTSLVECWKAFTTSDALSEWFCVKAESTFLEGEDLLIQSVYPGLSGRHQIEQIRDPEGIEITLFIEGVATNLEIDFSESEKGCRVRLVHLIEKPHPMIRFIELDSGKHQEMMMRQLWIHILYCLRAYLEDDGEMAIIPVRYEPVDVDLSIPISATKEKIWDALIDEKKLLEWQCLVGKEPKVELSIGGRYSFGWPEEEPGGDGPNKIINFEEQLQLECSWFGLQESLISLEIEAQGCNRCILHFKHHYQITSWIDMWSYRFGWSESLFCLKRYLERGENHKESVTG